KQHGKEKKHLIDMLLDDGRFDQVKLLDFYKTKYLYPVFNPELEGSDPDLIEQIKVESAKKLYCLPLSQDFETVTVAMANPLNLLAQDALRLLTKRRIRVLAAGKDILLKEIELRYREEKE